MIFQRAAGGAKNLKCIAFLGDSMMITPDAGAGTGPDAWPVITGAARNFTNVVVAAVVGNSAAQMHARIDEVLRHRPGAIAIMCGTNDANFETDLTEFETTVRTMTAKCLATGAKLTLCPPPLRRDDDGDVDPYAAKVRLVAGDTSGVILFDVHERFDTYDTETLDAYFAVDGVHLTSLGHGAIKDMALEPQHAAAFRAV